jgi:ABC-type uncharacterized transport system permease subunit
LLGLEWRQWRSTAWLSASAHLGDSRLFVFDYAIRALRVAVLVSIWTMLVGADPDSSPLPLPALLTYTIVAEAFAHAIHLQTGLANAFWNGSLVNYFLRPAGVVRQFAAESAGHAVFDFMLFSLPLLFVAACLGIHVVPESLESGLLFGLSLLLSLAVGLAIEFIAGAIAMVSEQPIWLIENVRRALSRLLSGAVLPLAILPFGLGDVLEWLPFAATAWAPLAIYTGIEGGTRSIALQLGWAVVLWPLALGLWHWNREKVVAYGG